MRNKGIRYAILGAVLLVLGVAGFFAWVFYYTYAVLQPEAYAVWQTADLVIDHMEKHGGAWPRGWDDLRPSAAPAEGDVYVAGRGSATEIGFRPPLDIEALQRLVEIDWSADPRELARAAEGGDSPPFRVIWLKSGRRTAFVGCEPNELIHHYLKGRYGAPQP
jgi:hypothetical protein